jgi:hypothetical protein
MITLGNGGVDDGLKQTLAEEAVRAAGKVGRGHRAPAGRLNFEQQQGADPSADHGTARCGNHLPGVRQTLVHGLSAEHL